MAGIVLGWYCDAGVPLIISLLSLSVVSLLTGILKFFPKWLFGAGAMCFLFSSGIFVEHMQSNAKQPEWSSGRVCYEATLVEVPAFRGTSVKVLADVAAVDTVMPPGVRCRGLAYLYFSRDVASDTLEVGDVVSFETVMQPPANAGNPAEFDLKGYCYVKGITGSAFLRSDAWCVTDSCNRTLLMRAGMLREKVVEMYRSLGYGEDEEALVSALTIGERRDFPQELKEEYTKAGASHVLALSGLHLGIFYMMLLFIFPYRGMNRWVVFVRELAVVLLLWAFAFVAGLAPSVLRAAILFSLMSLARCLERENSSLSALSFAAILMLLYDPHLLFDVSFQLSFAAVLSILLLSRPLQGVLDVAGHGVVYGYVANLFILSLAAQVGTFPLIWYHFGAFPLYFFLTNLFVVPMAFVLMFLSVVLCCAVAFPLLQSCVAWLLNIVAVAMNGVVGFVSNLPGSSFELPSVGVAMVAVMAFLLLLMISAVVTHKRWLLALVLLFIAIHVTVCFSLSGSGERNGYLLIYNNRKNPLIHMVPAIGDNYLVSTVSQDDAEYEYCMLPYIRRERLDSPVWVGSQYGDSIISMCDGLLSFGGLELKLLDHGNWQDNTSSEPVDILLLCRGFLGKVKDVAYVYPAACVVLDGSLYRRSRDRIMRECRELGIEAVDISEIGAVKVVPDGDSFTLYSMNGN